MRLRYRFACAFVGLLSLVSDAAWAEEEVSLENGLVTLAGTLTLPPGPGPHPAVVFLHGSGPVTREGAAPYAESFAEIGLASLRFDKRGTGTSTGSWVSSSLEDLARDAVTALDYLRGRPEIDSDRVGFWGVSQAGWVAVRATALTHHLAFMVIISGGGVSPYESEMYAYRVALEEAGFGADEVNEALATVDLYMDYMRTGEGREATAAAIEASKQKPWYPQVRLDRILPSTEEGRERWSWVARWDPAPLAELVTCPVLILVGGRDRLAPPEASIAAWRDALVKAGNPNYRIELFPEAGHGIRMWGSAHHGEGRPPFADGYLELMHEWLEANVVAR